MITTIDSSVDGKKHKFMSNNFIPTIGVSLNANECLLYV